MTPHERKIKILKNYLESFEMAGVCGFGIDEEKPTVILMIDKEFIRRAQMASNLLAIGMRMYVKRNINKVLGFDIEIKSTAADCNKKTENYSITESQFRKLTESVNNERLRTMRLIKNLLSDANIPNKRAVEKIEVNHDKFDDESYGIEVYFKHGLLTTEEQDNFLDDCWRVIYEYTGQPVYLIKKYI